MHAPRTGHEIEVPEVESRWRPSVVAVVVLAVAAVVVPVSAIVIEDPVTTLTHEYDGTVDLSPYHFDRYQPSWSPPYTPTLTEGTYDGRSVGIFHVDGAGPIAGGPSSFYRFQGFKHTLDGTDAGVYDNGFGTCLQVTFHPDDDFATSDRLVSFWATTNDDDDSDNTGRAWPIAGVRGYADATPDELWFWVSGDTTAIAAGWTVLPVPAGWDPSVWHTFTYVLAPYANVWYLDGDPVWTDAAVWAHDQSEIDYLIFNNENFGEDYDVYVDTYRVGSCTTDTAETVRPGSLGGWSPAVSNTAVGGAATGYSGAGDRGDGAWVMDTGSGDGAGAGGKAWLYTDDLSGVLLAELTELQYSTYVDSTSTAASHLAPALNLQIDWDDDGTRDTTLVWEPVYVAAGQGAVTTDTWQEWDALSDAWWYTSAFGSLVTPGGQFEPLGYYLDRYPNARIVNWGGHTPGTAMVSGQSSGGIWAGFVGAVDGFTYAVANGNRTTVDFEPPFVGLDDFATTQITAATSVDLSVPLNLSAINGSILAVPPYDTFVGIDVVVDWELKSGPTVVDSGTATVPAGDVTATIDATLPEAAITAGVENSFTMEISSPVNAVLGPSTTTSEVTVQGYTDAVSNVTPPVVMGTAHYWATLTVDTGTWAGGTPITYTYQWQRCDAAGSGCFDLIGATDSTHIVMFGDLDATLRVKVTATNVVSSDTAVSAATLVATIGLGPGGTFIDDDGNIHEGNIEALAHENITLGCNPPTNDRYCPDRILTRGGAAAFLTRAFDLPVTGTDYFTDDDTSVFEDEINRLMAAGITRGCNPPANDRYCPDQILTRGEIAAFINRAFALGPPDRDYFTDDDTSIFEDDVNRIATADITNGCNPPANDRYCPIDDVARDSAASFVARALGLLPMFPPPRS